MYSTLPLCWCPSMKTRPHTAGQTTTYKPEIKVDDLTYFKVLDVAHCKLCVCLSWWGSSRDILRAEGDDMTPWRDGPQKPEQHVEEPPSNEGNHPHLRCVTCATVPHSAQLHLELSLVWYPCKQFCRVRSPQQIDRLLTVMAPRQPHGFHYM